MSNIVFKVSKRDVKLSSKQIRRAGQTPGIIYGEFLEEPIPVTIPNSELIKMFKHDSSGFITTIDVDGKNYNCIIKDVQKNNFQEVLHIDLQYVKPNERIKLRVPVKFFGQEALENKKLVLETFNTYIDFQGTVEQIPESIEINVSEMNFDDKLFVRDIEVPAGITLISSPETLLAVVNA